MMYFNNTGGAEAVASGASKANPYIEAGKIIGELTVGAVDASKRRAMDYNIAQQRLSNELGLAKSAQDQQFSLSKLNILAQAQSGASSSDTGKADNAKLYLAIGVGAFVVLGTLMYVIVNR
jgi:hypothetical protein